MERHVGIIIRDELRRQGHTNKWLADKIGVTVRQLQRFFNDPSIISAGQLLDISMSLGIDLFYSYSKALNFSETDPPRRHNP